MVKITYVEWTGESHTVEGRPGQSVMEAAVKSDVPGIAADCGGTCACGTCRVYVEETWCGRTGEAGEMELEMLDFEGDPEPYVRLSCQIKITEDLDGLVVRMPQSQLHICIVDAPDTNTAKIGQIIDGRDRWILWARRPSSQAAAVESGVAWPRPLSKRA